MHYNRLVFYTTLGSTLEFFDFTLYALFAPYISRVFFPEGEQMIAMINTFVIFALGYFARPAGSFIFGHMGDKYGRKNTFTLTIVLMSASTFLIALLPGYNVMGLVSPILLLILRLIQGISLGGEVSGSAIFLAEHMPVKTRGFGVSLIFAGLTFGNVLGSGFGVVLNKWLTSDQILAFGWRIPFMVGGVLGLVSYKVRRKAAASPVFIEMVNAGKTCKAPVTTLFKHHRKSLIQGVGITALMAVGIFTLLYFPTYFSQRFGVNQEDGYLYSIYSFSLLVIFCVIFGCLSNSWGRKKLLITGSALMLVLGYPLFLLISLFGLHAVWLFAILFAFIMGMINACYGCMLVELYPATVRYSGMSFSYNISFALFGGLAPLINSVLLESLGQSFSFYYLLGPVAFFTLVSSLSVPDRRKTSLSFQE